MDPHKRPFNIDDETNELNEDFTSLPRCQIHEVEEALILNEDSVISRNYSQINQVEETRKFNRDWQAACDDQVHKTEGAELLNQYSIITPNGDADKCSFAETLDQTSVVMLNGHVNQIEGTDTLAEELTTSFSGQLNNVERTEILKVKDLEILKLPVKDDNKCLTLTTAPDKPIGSMRAAHSNKEERRFCCGVCNIAFKKASHLKDHLKVHTGEKNYCCEFCDKRFSRESHLKRHIQIHTKTKPYTCKICNKASVDPQILKNHTLRHSKSQDSAEKKRKRMKQNRDAQMQSEQRSANSVDSRNWPSVIRLAQMEYFCGICNKGFTVPSRLDEHLLKHTGEKPYSCEFCDKRYASARLLREHVATHVGKTKSNSSENCNEELKHRESPSAHSNSHGNKHDFRNTILALGLKRRKLSGRSSKVKREVSLIECRNQQNAFLSHLREHAMKETKKRLRSCEFCYKRHTKQQILKEYWKTHTKKKLYSCEICSKQFGFASILNYHSRRCTPLKHKMIKRQPLTQSAKSSNKKTSQPNPAAKKNYSCEVCHIVCKKLSRLKEHMVKHSDERPFKCEYCDKTYKTMKHLKVHRNIHTREKQFDCNICNKKLASADGLRTHRQIHTGYIFWLVG